MSFSHCRQFFHSFLTAFFNSLTLFHLYFYLHSIFSVVIGSFFYPSSLLDSAYLPSPFVFQNSCKWYELFFFDFYFLFSNEIFELKGHQKRFLTKAWKEKTSDKNPLLAVKKFLSFLICLYYFFYYFCPICFVFFLSFSFWTAVELIRCEIKAAFISEKTKKTRQWARNGKLAN